MRLAALVALRSIYCVRLWRLVPGLLDDPAARRFVIAIAVAFLPAARVGLLAHDAVRHALANLASHCFKLFAWWRVIPGSLGLIALALAG
jgi:undecaprenyl pyrophosphate phosphatase UppP